MDELLNTLDSILRKIQSLNLRLSDTEWNTLSTLLSGSHYKSGEAFKKSLEELIISGEKHPFKDKDIPAIITYLDKWNDITQLLISWYALLNQYWKMMTKESNFCVDALMPITIALIPDLPVSDLIIINEAINQITIIYSSGEAAYGLMNLYSGISQKVAVQQANVKPESEDDNVVRILNEILLQKEIQISISLCDEYLTALHLSFVARLKIVYPVIHKKYVNDHLTDAQKEEIAYLIGIELEKLHGDKVDSDVMTVLSKFLHVSIMRKTLKHPTYATDEKLIQFAAQHTNFMRHFNLRAEPVGTLKKPPLFLGYAYTYLSSYLSKQTPEGKFLRATNGFFAKILKKDNEPLLENTTEQNLKLN